MSCPPSHRSRLLTRPCGARVAREPRRAGFWALGCALAAAGVFRRPRCWRAPCGFASFTPSYKPAASIAPVAQSSEAEFGMIKNLPVLEDYDVLANFDALSELPADSAQRANRVDTAADVRCATGEWRVGNDRVGNDQAQRTVRTHGFGKRRNDARPDACGECGCVREIRSSRCTAASRQANGSVAAHRWRAARTASADSRSHPPVARFAAGVGGTRAGHAARAAGEIPRQQRAFSLPATRSGRLRSAAG